MIRAMSISTLVAITTLALVAQPTSAQVFWQFGPREADDFFTVTASGATQQSEIWGTRPTAGTYGEIAIAEALLRPGDQVPLPVYADGSQASENEIFWTAHLWKAHFPERTPMVVSPRYAEGDYIAGGFSGRTWTSCYGVIGIEPGNSPPDRYAPKTNNIEVLVTVVAVRAILPTPVVSRSWGRMKVTYR